MTTDQPAPAYLDPIRDELDRLRTENAEMRRTALTVNEWIGRLEQAEARIDQLTDTLTRRSDALNRTGADNDQLRAKVARVEGTIRLIASDDLTAAGERMLRAALADPEPTTITHGN